MRDDCAWAFDWLEAHRVYQMTGVLPNSGGLDDQDPRFVEVMLAFANA